jgi:hypothetical protein
VKRITYLVAIAFLAMMILVPTALAQDILSSDDDPMAPEPNAIELSHEELQQIAGQPLPSQMPTSEPLPQTGAPAVVLPAKVMRDI